MKALVGAFNQEKALVGAFSVITNLRMDIFEALAWLLLLLLLRVRVCVGKMGCWRKAAAEGNLMGGLRWRAATCSGEWEPVSSESGRGAEHNSRAGDEP